MSSVNFNQKSHMNKRPLAPERALMDGKENQRAESKPFSSRENVGEKPPPPLPPRSRAMPPQQRLQSRDDGLEEKKEEAPVVRVRRLSGDDEGSGYGDYKAEYRRIVQEERDLKEEAYAHTEEQKRQDAELAERQKKAKTKGEWLELERQRRMLVGTPTPQQQQRLDELQARRLELEQRMAPPAPEVEVKPSLPRAQPNFSQMVKETANYNAAWDWDNDSSVTNGTDNVVKAIMKANNFDQYTEEQQHAILDAINRGGGLLIEYELPVSDAFFGAFQHSIKGVLDLSFSNNDGTMTPKERIEHAVRAQLEKEQQRVLKAEGHRQFMHTHYTVSNPKIEFKEQAVGNGPIDKAIASIPNFQTKLNKEIEASEGQEVEDIKQSPTLMAAAREAVKTYGYGLNSPEDYHHLSDHEKAQKILEAASAILEKDQRRTLGQLNSAQLLNNAETMDALRSDTYLAKQYAKLLGIPPENATKLLTEPVADEITLAGYNSEVDKETYRWAWLGGGLLGEGIAALRVALSEHHHDKKLEKPSLMELLADPGNRLRLSQKWQEFKKAYYDGSIEMPADNPFPQLLGAVGKLGGGTSYHDNSLHENPSEDTIHAFDRLFSRTDINDNDNLPEQIKHNRDTHRKEGEAQIAEAVKTFQRLEALKIIANSEDTTRFQSASKHQQPSELLTPSERQQLEKSVDDYQQQLIHRLDAENDDLHNYMTNEEEWDAEVKELATNIMPLFSGFVTGAIDAKEGKGWQAAEEFGQALFEVAALVGGPITEALEEAEVLSSQAAQVMRYIASGINKAYGYYGAAQIAKEAVEWLQAELSGDRERANALLSSLLLSARNLAVFSAVSGAIEKARARLGTIELDKPKTQEEQQFVEDIIGNREKKSPDFIDEEETELSDPPGAAGETRFTVNDFSYKPEKQSDGSTILVDDKDAILFYNNEPVLVERINGQEKLFGRVQGGGYQEIDLETAKVVEGSRRHQLVDGRLQEAPVGTIFGKTTKVPENLKINENQLTGRRAPRPAEGPYEGLYNNHDSELFVKTADGQYIQVKRSGNDNPDAYEAVDAPGHKFFRNSDGTIAYGDARGIGGMPPGLLNLFRRKTPSENTILPEAKVESFNFPDIEEAKTDVERRFKSLFTLTNGGEIKGLPKESYTHQAISHLKRLGLLDDQRLTSEGGQIHPLELLPSLSVKDLSAYLEPHALVELGLIGPKKAIEGVHILQEAFKKFEDSEAYKSANEDDRVALRERSVTEILNKIGDDRKALLRESLNPDAYNSIQNAIADQMEVLSEFKDGDKQGNSGQINRLIVLSKWIDELYHQLNTQEGSQNTVEVEGTDESGYFPVKELELNPISIPSNIIESFYDSIIRHIKSEREASTSKTVIQDMTDDPDTAKFVLENWENEAYSKENLRNISVDGDNLIFEFKDRTLVFSNRPSTNNEYRGNHLKEYAEKTDFKNFKELAEGNIPLFQKSTNAVIAYDLYHLAQEVGANTETSIKDVIFHFNDQYKLFNKDRVAEITNIVLGLFRSGAV